MPELQNIDQTKTDNELKPRTYEIYWLKTLIVTYIHVGCLIGIWYHLSLQSNPRTLIWAFVHGIIGSMGNMAGIHRLWAHKSYKANLKLKIILMIMTTFSWSNDIFSMARDHRVHHKYSDTDADPHNPKRGFFYAHIGWYITKKHPDVIEKGKLLDISDLKQDKVVMFQKKYYYLLIFTNCLIMPTIVPIYFWGEDPWISWFGATLLSITSSANIVMWINSAGHLWGPKPYDKNIAPTDNRIATIISLGEGFHNYHHSFPWDYKASEYSWDTRNMTTAMINIFAKIGWAYDLKEASPELIRRKVARSGDGNWKDSRSSIKEYFNLHYNRDYDKEKLWGWGDESMPTEDVNYIKISNRLK